MNEFKQLLKKLAELFPIEDNARMIVDFAEIPSVNIDFGGAPKNMWYKILSESRKHQNGIKRIVQMAHSEYPDDPVLANAIRGEAKVEIKAKESANDRMKKAFNFDKADLQNLVAQNRLADALSKLKMIGKSLTSDFQNDIILFTAQLDTAESDKRRGIISREDYDITIARLRVALLSQIDSIDNESEIVASLNRMSVDHQPEALVPLNVDTEALEKIIGSRNDLYEIEWLEKAIKASKSVCKVELAGGGSGTGWVYKNKYLITNNHVINSAEVAKKAKIIFNYQIGRGTEMKSFRLDPSQGFFSSPPTALDYVCVPVIDDGTLSQYRSLEVDPSFPLEIGDLVNIIQHPMAGVKKIAMPDEIIGVWKEKNHLFYQVDTQAGSSGSPVFNQEWKVVALHHAGKDEDQGGFAINEAGEMKAANRGIFISAIIDDLQGKI